MKTKHIFYKLFETSNYALCFGYNKYLHCGIKTIVVFFEGSMAMQLAAAFTFTSLCH
jgi:hypothetical protein